MQGIVKWLSQNNQRAAVLTDYGYTVFDIESGSVSYDDIVSGNLDEHGSDVLTNQTTGQTLSVDIEAIQVTASVVQSLISYGNL
ncbi:MAG: hypothetical protein ACRCV6_09135 [Formosimonas sp.]